MQHAAFSRVREVLRLPGAEAKAHEFHFHLVGGARDHTVSLGHILGPADPVADARITARVAEIVIAAKSVNKGLPNIIREFGTELQGWAYRHIRRSGQLLGKKPSRLEKCLVIQAAIDSNDKWAKDAADDLLPLTAASAESVRCFKVDDYLGRPENLLNFFRDATGTLGGINLAGYMSSQLSHDEETAAFLAAEVLQFWRDGEPATEFLKRSKEERPGIAILPFRVLGQYRAAGVWFYEGEYKEDSPLAKHLRSACAATRWLEPLFDLAVLSQTRQALIDAIHGTAGVELGNCKRLQDTIRGLWFANSVQFLREGTPSGILPCTDTVMQKLPLASQTINLKIDNDAAKLLGFDELQYQCPLSPCPNEAERAKNSAQAMLQAVKLAAGNVQRLIEDKAKQQAVAQIDATAHDMVNHLRPIRALSMPRKNAQATAQLQARLDVIHVLAQQVEGTAWAMRNWVHGAGPVLEFSSADPTRQDFDFWRNALRTNLLASAADVRLRRPPHAGSQLTLTLSFRARDLDAEGGRERFGRWENEVITPEADGPHFSVPPDPDSSYAPWPLQAELSAEHSKFGMSGRIGVIMNGAVELIRNAAADTCMNQHYQPLKSAMTVKAAFVKLNGAWRFSTVVSNSLNSTAKIPPSLRDMRSIQAIERSFRNGEQKQTIARFRQLTSVPGVARYAFILKVSPGSQALWSKSET